MRTRHILFDTSSADPDPTNDLPINNNWQTAANHRYIGKMRQPMDQTLIIFDHLKYIFRAHPE